jgi:hypothetical protein
MDLWCVAATVVALSAAIWATVLIVQTRPPDSRLVTSLSEVIEIWRRTRTIGERLIVLWVITWTILRPMGRWGALGAFYTLATACLSAVCGFDIFEGISRLMRELPPFIREFRKAWDDVPVAK